MHTDPASILTRIDPDLPLCWEDPDTLRIGFERAEARVRGPSAGSQRLLASLRAGVSSIEREARRAGATPRETRELLGVLDPVLRREHPGRDPADPRPPRGLLRVQICDDGREPPGLRRGVGALERCALEPGLRAEHADLVVLVERFVEPFERARRWLAAAVPHLPVRYTDRAVHIGPLIAPVATPEGAPCHGCTTLALLAADPALPAIAAQLAGSRPASETAAAGELAAALAGVLIRRWLEGDAEAHRSRIVLPIAGGEVSGAPRFERVLAHPDCACVALREAQRAGGPAREAPP